MKHLILLAFLIFPQFASATDKAANLRIAPVALLKGLLDVGMDFPVNPNWTLGPTLAYESRSGYSNSGVNNISISATGIGARATWYENGVFTDGWYVSPLLQYISVAASSGTVKASVGVFGIAALGGYHWFWESFNLGLGAGVASLIGNATMRVTDSSNSASADVPVSSNGNVVIDFTIGFTF